MDANGQTTNEVETQNGPSFEERLEMLTRDFPPERVRWRLMQRPRDGQTRGLAVAYVNVIDVEDWLDEIMGAKRWRDTYPFIGKFVICRLELQDDDGKWVGKEDGAGDNVDREDEKATDDDLDKDTKAVLSDAFKRAARRWGIGRYLARLEKPWVDCKPAGRSWAIADHEYPRLATLAGAPPTTYVAPAPPQQQQPQQQPAPTYQQASQQPGQTSQRPPQQQQQQQAPARGHGGNQGGPYGGQQNRQQGGQGTPKIFKIPGGRAKDTPLAEASEQDILFWRDKKSQNDDPKYARSNQEWVAAADAELLARRNGGGSNSAPVQRPDSSRSRGNRPPPDRGGYQGPPADDIPFGAPDHSNAPRDANVADDYPF